MSRKLPARRAVKRRRINFSAIILAVLIILAASLNLALYRTTVEESTSAFDKAYTESKEAQTPLTYEQYYLAALEQYKTTNDIRTDITADYGNGKLEVMKIYDTVAIPQTAEEDGVSSLTLVIPVNGVYTADLQLAEFITDQQRRTVMVRIPYPELSDITVDYDNAKLVDESGIVISAGKMTTPELAHSEFEEKSIDVRELISSNKVFSENAAETVRRKITSAIMALNPYEDVITEVEFIN
ncbi:hypothetical protein [Ruminococcus sp. HUN007]|uniref:hypothetical protein n=1 Tax=Ruminococcus sp. HUN007 TaxID=1514668 RepID=UPI0005D214BC|nr:hypothetical protein [Ruminococcus sp. HUN007]